MRNYYNEAASMVWGQRKWTDALDLLGAAQTDLAAALARAEAAEANLATLRRYANAADKSTMERIARIDELEAQLAAATQRAEAAEARLALVDEYASYRMYFYDDSWGIGTRAPMSFDEWLTQRQEAQP